MGFDTRTLLLAGSISLFVCTIPMIWSLFLFPKEKVTLQWSFGFFIIALATIGAVLRDLIPDFFSIVAANTLMVAGVVMMANGIQLLYDKQPNTPRTVLFLTAVFCGLLFFTYIKPDYHIRSILTCSGLTIGLTHLTILFLSNRNKFEKSFLNYNLGILFLFVAVVTIGKIIFHITNLHQKSLNIFTNNNYNIFWLLSIQLATYLGSFGFLLLLSQMFNHKLNKLAQYDELTGLLNRRAFSTKFASLPDMKNPPDLPAYLLLIDIDDFKRFNDKYGHFAGDKILIAFSKLMTEVLPPGNLLMRMGGEEFCVLLFNPNKKEVSDFANKLCHLTGDLVITWENSNLSITISIGISTVSKLETESLNQAIIEADRALYKAKNSGKNCVLFYETSYVNQVDPQVLF